MELDVLILLKIDLLESKVEVSMTISEILIFINNQYQYCNIGVYETPAGTVLRAAHLDLEGITMDREVMRIRDMLSTEFARLCYNGFWYAPEMELILNSIEYSQRYVTGAVELKLYKGNVIILGRESEMALYSADLASMDIDDGGKSLEYNPADAEGFIKINAVRLRANTILRKHTSKLSKSDK